MEPVSFSSKSSVLKVTFLALISPVFVSGSHFRGGIITWRPEINIPPPQGTFPTVLFDYRVAFRNSYGPQHFCDQTTIDSDTINAGQGFLKCDNGCTSLNDDFDYKCTDFSVVGDWTTGVGKSQLTPTSNVFEVFYEGNAWIPLANGGNGEWILRSRVDLTPRSDNGLLNSSPTTSNMPIVRIPLNCSSRFLIPVTDPDGDVVRCRYAEAVGNECGAICGELSATLDEATCILEWTPAKTGLFGVAIQIEDFVNAFSTVPLSSIPLQFLFEVFESDGSCADAPVFDPAVLSGESCIAVPSGQTFTTRIEAIVSHPSRRIVEINTVSPVGLTTTSVQQVPGSDVAYFIDVLFTSSTKMQQQEIFCFVAEDSGRLTSEQRCVFLVTATAPPTPLGAIIDGNNLITITIDRIIRRPDMSRFIRIVSAGAQQPIFTFDSTSASDVIFPVSGTSVEIQLPSGLPAGDTYQVSLDRGAIETNDFCGVENEPTALTIAETACSSRAITATATGPLSNVYWASPAIDKLFSSNFLPGDMFHPGVTKVVYRIEDDIVCTFSVIVEDTTPPEIEFCNDNLIVKLNDENMYAAVEWPVPTVTDTEGGLVTLQSTSSPGDRFYEGRSVVEYNFFDTFNNVASCRFNVDILGSLDKTPPEITNCRDSTVLFYFNEIRDRYEVILPTPSAVDDSGFPVSVSSTYNSRGGLGIGWTDVTYTFTDQNSNVATCQFPVVIVKNNTQQVVRFQDCPSDLTVNASDSNNSIEVFWMEPTLTGLDGRVTLRQSHFPGDVFEIGSTKVTYVVEKYGNAQDVCQFNVEVKDISSPLILNCPQSKKVVSCRGSRTVNWREPVAIDNSNVPPDVFQSHYPRMSLFQHGTTTVSYTFRDGCGNIARCSFNITHHKGSCLVITVYLWIIFLIILLIIIIVYICTLVAFCSTSEKRKDKKNRSSTNPLVDNVEIETLD
ncbi:Hyalin [Holothuria leucospilota]|uniref:Hyalin n=1 Tax=Holothuria leucospilota TaxID=206669 RepID=A0A9Q0YMI4_HOLLE|nr:Hyalin [Holothuria leucospilota]